MVVMAETDPDAGHEGISAFLVPTDTDGLQAEKSTTSSASARQIGRNRHRRLRVPEENLIGTRAAASTSADFFTSGRAS